MLPEKRLHEILKIVEKQGSVTVQELTEQLQASESTIRRDIIVLHQEGKLNRVHGGATAVRTYKTKDEDISLRKNHNKEEKIQIVKYAASLIHANDFVYLDAGSTTEILIDYITEKDAVYVTDAIVHAKRLAEKGCEVYVIGGKFKLSTEAIVGNNALIDLEKYNFTLGFWGTNGISLKKGFSTPDIEEAMIKKKSMKQCKNCYIVSDSTKFNQISAVTFANFYDAKIITNQISEKEFLLCKNIVEVKKDDLYCNI